MLSRRTRKVTLLPQQSCPQFECCRYSSSPDPCWLHTSSNPNNSCRPRDSPTSVRSQWRCMRSGRHRNRVRRILGPVLVVSCHSEPQALVSTRRCGHKTHMIGDAIAMLVSTHTAPNRVFVRGDIVLSKR